MRQLALFEADYSALAEYKRAYPIEVKPRGKPFEKGNTMGKRFT
jgi:hypothetical protein